MSSRIPTLIKKTYKRKSQTIMRLSMPILVLLFCASFNWSYEKWISPVWGYFGLTYKSANPMLLITGYGLAFVVCALSPLRILRPSQLTYWLLYFTVYIPGLFAPLFMQLDTPLTLLSLQLSLTAGMLLIALSYRVNLLKLPYYPTTASFFWTTFLLVFSACNATLFLVFRGSLHLASLSEVYSVRRLGGAIGEASFGITYVSTALSSVMNPFLIAYGLSMRRRKAIALGALGQVLVYATAAMRSVVISPILIAAFYFSLKKDRGGWAPKLGALFTVLFVVLTALTIGSKEGFFFSLASGTILRSFALPGLFVGQYQYFFEHFPHTYLGHVSGISLILPTSYAMPTGKEISTFFIGGGENGAMNSNACFFAFDGIAGFGLPGIPLMGIVCAAMFWVLDSCARKYPVAMSAGAMTMCTVSLTNGSLFTTFLSGGVLAFMLLFVVAPLELRAEQGV